uniref:Uncharacterized protein n=1 Tax=Leptobrachium leishanense TaxID=445787 RepID=A0A8C5MQD9_9ANUR
MGLCVSSEAQGGISFHAAVRGQHIAFGPCNHHVERIQSFHNGLLFSDRPLHPKEKLWVRIALDEVRWYGGLRLGFTSVDPNSLNPRTLPPFACPDLAKMEGFWAACIPEELCQVGSLMSFWVNRKGQAFCQGENDRQPRKILKGISRKVPLWAIVDVYGRTKAIQLLESSRGKQPCPCNCLPNKVSQTQTSELSPGCKKPRGSSYSSSFGPENPVIFSISKPIDSRIFLDGDPTCVICMDRPTDAMLTHCQHRSFCMNCALKLYRQNANCPLCRQKIFCIQRTTNIYGLTSNSAFSFANKVSSNLKSSKTLRKQKTVCGKQEKSDPRCISAGKHKTYLNVSLEPVYKQESYI